MNTPENEYTELRRLLASFGAATARLAERVERMEARQIQTEALLREIKGEPNPRRKFRGPLDLGKVGG